MDIRAVGAHPDDVVLGCGSLLIKATNGSVSGERRERVEESMKYARFIGARGLWVDDSEIPDLVSSELINHIEPSKREWSADEIRDVWRQPSPPFSVQAKGAPKQRSARFSHRTHGWF